MTSLGHNESAVRLAALAGDAQIALDKIAKAEADAIDGWLAYGAALNEGRALFAGDAEFGKWVAENSLRQVGGAEIHDHERAAAMWAAANADQLAEARANSKARTLRGWHDQWKKIEQEREKARKKAEREAEEARKREEAEKARKEIEAAEKAAAEARAAAESAPTEEARQEAEAKASQAVEVKAKAEKIVQEVEAEIAPEEPEIDPEIAKVMRELARMTPEGVAQLVLELRTAVADQKAKNAKQKSEIEMLKSRVKELSQEGQGKTIADLQSRCYRLKESGEGHQANAARLQRQVNAQKAEIDRLRKEIENQVVTL